MTQFYQLPSVSLFASGTYRGRRWSPEVVRLIAQNGQRLGPSGERLLMPPAAPGHEDDNGWQEFVGRTDVPAAGWVDPDSLRVVPDPLHPGEVILKGDIVNVPPAMAELIRQGKYAFGSSEIYSDFLNDMGESYGQALRKFSYLGSEVPQVKRLGRLPAPVPMPAPLKFAERRDVRVVAFREAGAFVAFAERIRSRSSPTSTRTPTVTTKNKFARLSGDVRLVAAWAGRNARNLALVGKTPEQFTHEFAESRRRRPGLRAHDIIGHEGVASVIRFAETDPAAAEVLGDAPMSAGGPLNRQEILLALKEAMPNLSDDTFKALNDAQLADLLKNLPAPATAPASPTASPQLAGGLGAGIAAMADGDPAAMPSPEEMVADLVTVGYSEEELMGLGEEELFEVWQSEQDADVDAEVGAQAAQFSEGRARGSFLRTYSEGKRRYGARRAKRMLLGR